MVKEDNF